MRRKALDLFLIVLLLGGFAYGAYAVGRLVTDTSNDELNRSSGTVRTPTKGRSASDRSERRRHRLEIIVGVIVAVVVVWIVLFYLVNALIRFRRRRRRRRRS